MNNPTIYSCMFGTGHGAPYPFGKESMPVRFPEDIKRNDGYLVIWGGEDIHPSIYKEPNVASYVGDTVSRRDILEMGLIRKAQSLGMLVVGICRGAQLCCALAGGKLAQDVSNHGSSHEIKTYDGKILRTSSVHHQMMYPVPVEHDLLAWSINRSQRYIGLTAEEILSLEGLEPEIVYFPKQKFLAIQGHPEFMDEDDEFNNYCRTLISKYL